MENHFLIKIGSLGLAKVPKVDFSILWVFIKEIFFINFKTERMIKNQVSTAAPLWKEAR